MPGRRQFRRELSMRRATASAACAGHSQTKRAQPARGRTVDLGIAKARATQSTPPLHPAEDLSNRLSLSGAHPVARMPRRAAVQARRIAALNLGKLRTD